MRGRLIFPFLAEVYRLDQVATAADPDGSGALTSGYDPVFRETRLVPTANKLGRDARKEFAPVKLPAQWHAGPTVGEWSTLMEVSSGNIARFFVMVLFHFADLEREDLVDVSGNARIKVGDRLNAVYSMEGDLIQEVPNPPGLFVTQALPIFGLSSRRNLLEVTFRSRDQGQTLGEQ